jgi:hypothetical protein
VASIGSLAVQFSVSTQQFDKGLSTVSGKLSGLGKAISSPINSITGLLGAPMRAIQGFLGPIQGLLTSIPFIGTAFAGIPLTGAGFFSWLKSGMDKITDLTRQADRFGISTEDMAGLMKAAGGDSDTMTMALGRMEAKLGQIRAGSRSAGKDMEKFGLNSQALAQATPIQALGMISDRLKAIQNPYERAALVTEVFSRRSLALTDKLARGSEYFRKNTVEAEKMGRAFSHVQADEVMKANKALKDISLTFSGLQVQFAIAFAPTIDVLATKFTELTSKMGGVGPAVASIVEPIVKIIGRVLDFVEQLKKASDEFDKIKQQFSEGHPVKGSLHAWNFLTFGKGNPLATLINTINARGKGVKTLGEMVEDEVFKITDAMKGKGKGIGTDSPFTAQIKGISDALEDQTDAIGLSGTALKIHQLQMQGALGSELQGVREHLAEVESMQLAFTRAQEAPGAGNIFSAYEQKISNLNDLVSRWPDLWDAAAEASRKLGESLDTAVIQKAGQMQLAARDMGEKFADEFREMSMVAQQFGLSQDDLAFNVAELYKKLQKEGPGGIPEKGPEALTRGSKEAVEALTRFERRQQGKESPEALLKRLADQQKEAQTENKKLLEDIVKAVNKQQPIRVVSP